MTRQVFTGQEVPHIFAQRSQDSARNSNGTLYFRGDTLFSYRDSFPIARFFGDIVLFNADSYSVTTGKHQSWARQALRHFESLELPQLAKICDILGTLYRARQSSAEWRQRYFDSAESDAMNYIKLRLVDIAAIEEKLPRMRSEWKISSARADISALEQSCFFVWNTILGKKSDWRKNAGAAIVKKEKQEKRARYMLAMNQLIGHIDAARANIPEMLQHVAENVADTIRDLEHMHRLAKQADSLIAHRGRNGAMQYHLFVHAEKIMGKKWADEYYQRAMELQEIVAPIDAKIEELRPIADQQERERNAERIEAWLSGATHSAPRLSRIYCRVIGEEVQTSMGARVPLRDALRVVEIAKRCRESGQGMERQTFATGTYKGIRVDDSGNVTIGCHNLPWDSIVECVARFAPEYL